MDRATPVRRSWTLALKTQAYAVTVGTSSERPRRAVPPPLVGWVTAPTVGRASGSGDGLILGGTIVVPSVMAMNLRLTDAESEALRAKAEQEGRSMQEVARTAIAQYVSDRPQRLAAAIQRVRTEDDELLERLSR